MSRGTGRVVIKITIGGVEAEIECEEGQLKKVVEEFLTAVQTQRSKEQESIDKSLPKDSSRLKATSRGIILSLWREGWFQIPRSLGETDEEMSLRGYHYDRTAIAHTLADLVREGILTRQGKAGKYLYVQKVPPKGV
ncbi:MAG: hypothetical protein QW220_02935 [Candidatus Bathyarchaeia archaeon]